MNKDESQPALALSSRSPKADSPNPPKLRKLASKKKSFEKFKVAPIGELAAEARGSGAPPDVPNVLDKGPSLR